MSPLFLWMLCETGAVGRLGGEWGWHESVCTAGNPVWTAHTPKLRRRQENELSRRERFVRSSFNHSLGPNVQEQAVKLTDLSLRPFCWVSCQGRGAIWDTSVMLTCNRFVMNLLLCQGTIWQILGVLSKAQGQLLTSCPNSPQRCQKTCSTPSDSLNMTIHTQIQHYLDKLSSIDTKNCCY